MKLAYINEPRLEFADGTHICPRRGISAYGVYDKHSLTRRTRIHLGAIGTTDDLEALSALLERMKSPIQGALTDHKGNLFPSFCGFNSEMGFHAELLFNQDLGRQLRKQDLEKIGKIKDRTQRIEEAIGLYYEEVKFLAPRVQIRSATLINGLGGRDGIASEPLDRQVKVAWNELHTSHPTRTIPNCHPPESRT